MYYWPRLEFPIGYTRRYEVYYMRYIIYVIYFKKKVSNSRGCLCGSTTNLNSLCVLSLALGTHSLLLISLVAAAMAAWRTLASDTVLITSSDGCPGACRSSLLHSGGWALPWTRSPWPPPPRWPPPC